MSTSASAILALVRETIAHPRTAARQVMGWHVSRVESWQLLALAVVLNVLLGQTQFLLYPEAAALWTALVPSPIVWAVLELLLSIAVVHLIFRIGRALGGTGGFDATILLVGWYLVVWFLLKLVVLALVLVLPPVAPIVTIVVYALALWVVLNLLTELHGFDSLGRAAGTLAVVIVVLFIGMAFVMTIVLALLGVQPEMLE